MANKTVGKTITCKAAFLREFNKPVTIETVEVLPPGLHEVRLKMVASGFCHSDLSLIEGCLPMQPIPCVLGHEGAGIVESIGEGVTSVKPGDKVLTVFLPQCRKCPLCQSKKTNYCLDIERKEKSLGPFMRTVGLDGTPRFFSNGQVVYHTTGNSSLSEYTVIPENSCVKVNPAAPLEKACIMACGFTTGYGASTNAVDIQPGETTAIWGMGGVGLAALMGCKHKSAGKIIAIEMLPEKKAVAKKHGCTDFICPKDLDSTTVPEAINALTGGMGVDFGIVCVGNPQAMEQAVLSTKIGGTTVIVGLANITATMTISPAFLLFNRKIVGTLIGDYKLLDDLPKLVDRYVKGEFSLDDFITGYYKLEDINKVIDIMHMGKSIRSIITF